VREIGYDGAITNGGAHAVRGDEVIFADPMPREDTDRLISYFEAEGIHYFLQSDEAVYASAGVGSMVDEFFERRRAQMIEDARRLGETVASEPESIISYRPIDEADLGAIAKTTFISTRPDSVERAREELGDRFHVIPGSIPLPGGSNGEIGLRGVTKGSAIARVLDVLGLDAADAIGIGDSWNDAEMFDVVGSPVAMGNADPALKERAGNVTTDVLDDGIWNAFVKLGLV
jgi:Cof subfamily protein (haloacid dehalogenase superfamily)